MTKILITGGTGRLGTQLFKELTQQQLQVKIASRNQPKDNELAKHWERLNLVTGTGIDNCLKNTEVIFHLASNPQFPQDDITGTEKLIAAAKQHGIKHFVYVSIVGIEQVPVKYYKYKLLCEKAVATSGLNYTIFRATQFHEFVDELLQLAMKSPIPILPKKAKVQPISTESVAQLLGKLATHQPFNKVIEIGGQKIYEVGEILDTWLKIQKMDKKFYNFPITIIGKLGKALVNGGLTTPHAINQDINWEQWLANKYKNA